MEVEYYTTAGGKNLILDYIDSLPKKESAYGYDIIEDLLEDGLEMLDEMDTRHIEGKLWEVKFYNHNRIFYALVDSDRIYLLHACKKQKNKAERFELKTARKRMGEINK